MMRSEAANWGHRSRVPGAGALPAPSEEDRSGTGEGPEAVGELGDDGAVLVRSREAALRVIDGRLKKALQFECTVLAMELQPARDVARDQGGEDAEILRFGGVARRVGRLGHNPEEVQRARTRLAGEPDDRDAGPTGTRHVRLDDAQGGRHSDGGVEGVASLSQYVHPRHRGKRVPGGDHTVDAHDDGAAGWWIGRADCHECMVRRVSS